jgi:hypothetical protein
MLTQKKGVEFAAVGGSTFQGVFTPKVHCVWIKMVTAGQKYTVRGVICYFVGERTFRPRISMKTCFMRTARELFVT